ncbi:GspH/FimT family pseudopilin [Cocleimonas sp. KMM 6892]|uniref:GspH/FimT family pseudopilin n=1 Tax=unclassified Cocleimonas TaxID=2639732 RepID=UPI002DB717FA|nr:MULTISPECIES: GspH/FimT family pseudopilin [unclassified Cocleimonas]MEB8430981.1 GspH/FimT family pseudopilin [Cocleimonas sp. KMM 6892]MEC4714247.1 GspH/FimT family pseudopilin [Cocleimonas sp. KMM 6895]MEC4743578.1 GspH/FimT family pseudopilin [Cocleimonas sp. KMM 6896]
MKNRSKIRNNSGFTLIEMIVTISIVAIFASIAVPSFSQLIRNNKIPTTTNEFISSMVLARSEALKRSRNVIVCASTDQLSCNGGTDYSGGWIVYDDCNGDGSPTAVAVDCNDDNLEEEQEIIKVHNGFDRMFINGTANNITFLFSGRVAGNTTFDVGHESEPTVTLKEVTVNRVGRIKSEDP